MKCDELEEEYLWTNNVKTPSTRMVRAYNADDVDKAIAELKARIQLDDDEMAGFLDLEEECGGGDLRNYIAELKAKLEENDKDIAYWREEYDKETKLTDALNAEIESLKASHYAEMVDAGMRERRLKRALYIVLARSFCCMRELAARNALYDDECKWDNFKTTCLKKAEEYK